MKKLLVKGRKTLSVIAVVLGTGLVASIISDKMPVNLVLADQGQVSAVSTEYISVDSAEITTNEVADIRVAKIKAYLDKRAAPLADYANEFVAAADTYQIDYNLVAAISVIESEGGKHTFRPYNAWGWGKSGFSSWEDGIWAVSKGLSKYYAKGMTTPRSISYSYCPPSADSWAAKVQSVMNKIEAL
ncbi:MAG: hypothetical protein UR96_C0047G0005 [candidate division WS6 bacterium GW2011_GWC1_36_11]|uniref:Mannosyl-glycoprotein endo-beta-N-acetylglucosamidase-like domain-containing protein n=3 Tax=Candidatus Dojkabacteria TaxID=74243 RepID=A0A0G0FRV7_9BACT|nr:MAG: hypothetical protein UR96_C0047G0005 [candidate division WS6 bacterium GW2011_GWC1_36_11]KKQ02888.1 MAG: hypothetical protein US14_C0044G0002 [candidate division WS6 bacterium GW2011_WS6_36_26]KKQ11698.1 MAG: hypothetical protein US24_C0018G0002 [candidate division WS6 bacterium GW2011_GWC2_36_7]KKQ16293.1 MAG: hypothetical protein US29_C0028G0002 [candidate division WS6 bacterium GW2011_GWF1_36_8]HAM37106.1 hypothetical protein [Patescibacteria group bacterium]